MEFFAALSLNNLILAVFFIVISYIDIKSRTIHDFSNLLLVITLVCRSYVNNEGLRYIAGGISWAFILPALYAWKRNRLNLIGGGDVKLMMAIGAGAGPIGALILGPLYLAGAKAYIKLTGFNSVPMAPIICLFASFFIF